MQNNFFSCGRLPHYIKWLKRGDFVLVAVTENQEKFIIDSKIPHTTLRRLREEKKFYCPQCGGPLQLKIGHIRIPHFAHITKSRCDSTFSEGETMEHLLGKEQLFGFFRSLELRVELESYLPELRQRPDLLVNKNDSIYAIEFQCSPIHHKRLMERNQGYLQKKIMPIWIPLTPVNKLNGTKGFQKVTLPHQLQQFACGENGPKFLMTYDPLSKQFVYLSNLIHLKGITFFSKVIPLPLFRQHFPFYLPKSYSTDEFSKVLKAYHLFIKHFLRSRVLLSRKGVNDLFLRSVYELRLNLEHLPSFLGVPICGNEALKVCAVEWQTELMYFIGLCGIKVHAINRAVISDFFRWSNRICTEDALLPVLRFVRLLQELGVENAESSVKQPQLEELLYRQFLATNVKD
ncbi:hypothetical protein FKZ59_05115 [Ureibacillus terrenus]|uniref:Competence protein CoiA n=1 Tax=Ureibacillus terrenus TaxID=118246 RepID=A0A540V3N4_9BACL|nr:hypothetical protein FKZ59_05115 [Ureibacillus terrenus]